MKFKKMIMPVLAAVCMFGCDRSIPTTYMPDPDLINNPIDRREVTSDSVVFVGDSLTHIGIWKDLFPGVLTSNQGWGGNITQQVIDRLEPIVAPQPKKIFLLIGANDLNFGVDKAIITFNHAKIIDTIQQRCPNTKLYVQSIFPFGEDIRFYFKDVPETFKQDILDLNAALKQICDDRKVPYLDVHNAVMVDDRGFLKQEYTDDRIHINEIAYNAWRDYLMPFVKE